MPPLLLIGGIGLIVWAALHGGATAYLILIFPVLTGNSGAFLLGVALLIVGMLSIPFTRMEADEPEQSAGSRPAGAPRGTTGGVLLIGPLPILFGSWKNVSPRQRWGLAILGTALLVLVVLVILFA